MVEDHSLTELEWVPGRKVNLIVFGVRTLFIGFALLVLLTLTVLIIKFVVIIHFLRVTRLPAFIISYG